MGEPGLLAFHWPLPTPGGRGLRDGLLLGREICHLHISDTATEMQRCWSSRINKSFLDCSPDSVASLSPTLLPLHNQQYPIFWYMWDSLTPSFKGEPRWASDNQCIPFPRPQPFVWDGQLDQWRSWRCYPWANSGCNLVWPPHYCVILGPLFLSEPPVSQFE